MNVYRTEMTPLCFLERSQRVYENRLGARARRLATALAKAGIRPGR